MSFYLVGPLGKTTTAGPSRQDEPTALPIHCQCSRACLPDWSSLFAQKLPNLSPAQTTTADDVERQCRSTMYSGVPLPCLSTSTFYLVGPLGKTTTTGPSRQDGPTAHHIHCQCCRACLPGWTSLFAQKLPNLPPPSNKNGRSASARRTYRSPHLLSVL